VEREPNIRPWKAFPKERIARSGEPILNTAGVVGTGLFIFHATRHLFWRKVDILAALLAAIIHKCGLNQPSLCMCTLYAVSLAQLPHMAVYTRVCPGGATDRKLSVKVCAQSAGGKFPASDHAGREYTEGRSIHQRASKLFRLCGGHERRIIITHLHHKHS